jgi:hypothetical protein
VQFTRGRPATLPGTAPAKSTSASTPPIRTDTATRAWARCRLRLGHPRQKDGLPRARGEQGYQSWIGRRIQRLVLVQNGPLSGAASVHVEDGRGGIRHGEQEAGYGLASLHHQDLRGCLSVECVRSDDIDLIGSGVEERGGGGIEQHAGVAENRVGGQARGRRRADASAKQRQHLARRDRTGQQAGCVLSTPAGKRRRRSVQYLCFRRCVCKAACPP